MPDFDSWIHFRNDASKDFEGATARLSRLEEAIKNKVGETIHDEMSDLSEQARSKLLGESVHGLKQTGLRARIAAGITVASADGGAEIRVNVTDDDMTPIPWGLDSASKGWKHPVFGRSPWVHQQGTAPWWSETMAQAQPNLEAKLPEKIDEAVRETFGD